jgi:hypothetical protein
VLLSRQLNFRRSPRQVSSPYIGIFRKTRRAEEDAPITRGMLAHRSAVVFGLGVACWVADDLRFCAAKLLIQVATSARVEERLVYAALRPIPIPADVVGKTLPSSLHAALAPWRWTNRTAHGRGCRRSRARATAGSEHERVVPAETRPDHSEVISAV